MYIPEILEWQHKLLHCDFEMSEGKGLGTKILGITSGTTLLKSVLDDKVSPAMEKLWWWLKTN